jgi:hypothetical protein
LSPVTRAFWIASRTSSSTLRRLQGKSRNAAAKVQTDPRPHRRDDHLLFTEALEAILSGDKRI